VATYSQAQIQDALRQIATGRSSVPSGLTGQTTTFGPPRSAPTISQALSGYSIPTGSSAEDIALRKARINAERRILADPYAQSSDTKELIRSLEAISQGGKPSGGFSLGNLLKGTLGKIGEGAMYVMGRPLAIVASAGKEISDIPSGKASLKDFLVQAAAKDTTVSKYLPKTGTKWLDQTIGMAADIAADPLTWFSFGASEWATRSGRIKLAAKAAEADNIAKMPSLLAKVENGSIAKLGEWALNAEERDLLGVRRGLRWQFGSQNVIGKEGTLLGKLSEGAATAVGKPMAHIRGGMGEIGFLKPFQELTVPSSIKNAGLTMYGRIKEDPASIGRIAQLASYSASIRANAAGGMIRHKFGSEAQKLVKNIYDYEAATGRKIFEVREGVRKAADETEQALVDGMSKFLDDTRNYANDITKDFANRRGVTAYEIAHRENYVPHTLSQEARDYIGRKRLAGTGSSSSIREMLGLTVKEFKEGPVPYFGRTLEKGKKFLGDELKSDIGDGAATLSEINRISQNKLKFKWFEEDGAEYLNNYLNSIVNQTKRVNFTDRLFDYGGSVVQKLNDKLVPDKKMIAKLQKSVDLYDNLMAPVLKELASKGASVNDILGPRLALAESIVASKPGQRLLSENQMAEIKNIFDQTVQSIRESDGIMASAPREIRDSYEVMSAPLKGRIEAVAQALANDDHETLVANLGLRELYQRLLPQAWDIPKDPKVLAEAVIDAAEGLRGTKMRQTLGITEDFADSVRTAAEGISKRGSITEVPTEAGPVVASRADAAKYMDDLSRQLAEKESARDGLIGMLQTSEGLPTMNAKTAATRDIKRLQKDIASIAAKRDEAITALGNGALPKEVAAIKSQATKAMNPKIKQVAEAQAVVDAGQSIGAAKAEWDATIGAAYKSDVENVLEAARTRPAPGAAGEITAQWAKRTSEILDSLTAPGLRLSNEERDVLTRVFTQMKGMESNLAMWEQTKQFSQSQLQKFASGEIGKVMSRDITKGWERMESLGVKMPPDVRDALFGRVKDLALPKNATMLGKMYSEYSKFFKVSAMLTPGFIVRNSYTAAFNNFVAGVSLMDTIAGIKFAKNVMIHGLDNALEMVPKAERALYEDSMRVVYATGAGQAADDIMAPILAGKASKLYNNKVVKGWSKANEATEIAHRFALAKATLKKGHDFDAAVNMVSRYHFNYGDLSKLDETARKLIPFWIFASRNIPLQIVNQVARPSLFRMYESAQRNFPATDTENFPQWIKGRGPIQLPFMSSGNILMPDLPQLDMQEQIRMMSDPMRLMSQFNPLLKLPIELAGNRQLWNDVPFSEKPSIVRGPLDYPALIAGILSGGAGRMPSTGQYYTSSKAAYAIPNLLPTLATLQRLLPKIPGTGITLGGKDSYQDRQSSSAASFIGLPYRHVSQDEQFNELQRRQFAIRDYLSGLTRRGVLKPTNQ
jgi:hypothetical protein